MVEFLHSRGSMKSMVNPWSVCWRLYLDHTENIFKILVFINVLIMHTMLLTVSVLLSLN